MKFTLKCPLIFGGLMVLLCCSIASATPDINGRWRLDTTLSSALDGWQAMDLVITRQESEVAVTHEMRWRTTRLDATNVFNTAQSVTLSDFFRVEQRHMAVYPTKGGHSHANSTWLDDGKTLRVEILTDVEVSQGDVTMRIYQEYRVSELNETLTLIELHSTRNRPLVYVFKKVTEEAK
jgi:hypothetical protein